jgi:uncharacterized membrane protein
MDGTWVAAAWLHSLAMVIVLGYYGILGRFVLPGLRKALDGETFGRSLLEIERRALPFLVLSVVLFTATGMYLLIADARYAGLGNLFASTWTTLLTVKHMVVVVMVVLAWGVDRLVVAVAETGDGAARETSLGILGLAAEGMTVLGAIVLLLTAAAQAS